MADAECDVLIVGGGTGGCAAAMAACSLGMRVIMTEPTTMIGGQLTAQMVPPDEHPWIEEFGCTNRYRTYRDRVRDIYRPMIPREKFDARFINPGGGWVSRLCHTPAAGLASLRSLLTPRRSGELSSGGFFELSRGDLELRLRSEPVGVVVDRDSIISVVIQSEQERTEILAMFVLDASELADLLPLAGAEYRCGSESRDEFDEPHGTPTPEIDNVQGFTWCFALGFDAGASHVIERPGQYDACRGYVPAGWPGPLFSFTFPDPVSGEPR